MRKRASQWDMYRIKLHNKSWKKRHPNQCKLCDTCRCISRCSNQLTNAVSSKKYIYQQIKLKNCVSSHFCFITICFINKKFIKKISSQFPQSLTTNRPTYQPTDRQPEFYSYKCAELKGLFKTDFSHIWRSLDPPSSINSDWHTPIPHPLC